MVTETEIQRGLDEQAIIQALHRYAFGVDNGDLDMVRGCFTPDVAAEYNGNALQPGVENVVNLISGAGGYINTMHHIGAVLVSDLTANTAKTEHYAIAYLLAEDPSGGHKLTSRGVHYFDEFQRLEAGWQISKRKHTVKWATEQAATATPPLTDAFLTAAGLKPGA